MAEGRRAENFGVKSGQNVQCKMWSFVIENKVRKLSRVLTISHSETDKVHMEFEFTLLGPV